MRKKESLPKYRKIMDYILDKINRGEWQVDDKIPSEAELVRTFSTSRMTVNRALRELANEGILVRRQGKGTYVAPIKAQTTFLEINSIDEEIKSRGGFYSCDIHLLCEEKAPPELARQIGLTPYAPVYHSIIVHKSDGLPILLADRFVNPAVVPQYLEQDFTKTPPTQYLLNVAPVEKIEHIVEAQLPASWIRDLLNINEAEPCLTLYRKTWSKSLIATKSIFYYPGSRYSLGGTFKTVNKETIRVS